jgi:hypothetical protein
MEVQGDCDTRFAAMADQFARNLRERGDVVGFPDRSAPFVTSPSHAEAIARLQEAIAASDSGRAYRLDRTGLHLIAARPAPEGERRGARPSP